ncbi:hypothetical protein BDN70DRAFT_797489 [Pholiota conissans]|uniref:cAMP-independent regulatory protein n=1 Tax=Pholiota conissans TaxID=109636 RepID=A0A9P5ZDB2_9AGAR|nr:hypothetical protein BDN70DRAFT_797489 [Pholiota conissans]
MSAAQQAQSANAWPEPPWSGWIETTGDALLILEAARRGLIPRVTRRLVDSERKMITSGSVFVFDEDESGIKRWTDGFFWSPSRILGNFLLYRETDKKGAGHRSARAELQDAQDAVAPATSFATDSAESLSRPKTDNTGLSVDKQRERSLIGSLTNSYKFKPDGLMKKTFSVTIGGVAQHLISYYKVEDVESGRLRKPSSLPELRSLDISPEYLDKTHFRNPPKVEVGVDGVPRYSGEADDLDNSPSILPNPLSTSGMPLLTEGRLTDHSMTQKRSRRFETYNAPPAAKRAKTNTVHRTDPSQSPQTAPPPGAPAQASVGHPFPPPPPHAQAPYYGYYHQPPPPQPGIGVGMHPHPHHPHSPMGVGIQYAGYPSWPMYSGFPPPPSLPQAHYPPPPAPQAAVQVPVAQPPTQKREEGRVGDGGGGGT